MANANTIAFKRFTEWRWKIVNRELEEKRKSKDKTLKCN